MNQAVIALILIAPGFALAHGADEIPFAPTAARAPTAAGTGDLFEVVVKWKPAAPGSETALTVFVADAKSNDPVAGADVELTFTRAKEIKVRPTAGEAAGIYLASVVFPTAGDWDAVASVTRAGEADVVALGHLDSDRPAPAPAPAPDRWPLLAAAAVIVALALGAILWRRREKHS